MRSGDRFCHQLRAPAFDASQQTLELRQRLTRRPLAGAGRQPGIWRGQIEDGAGLRDLDGCVVRLSPIEGVHRRTDLDLTRLLRGLFRRDTRDGFGGGALLGGRDARFRFCRGNLGGLTSLGFGGRLLFGGASRGSLGFGPVL
jgi:hypothetical protein